MKSKKNTFRCIEYIMKNDDMKQKQAIGKYCGLCQCSKKNKIMERIELFLEQGTVTADIDVTPCANLKKKKKKRIPLQYRVLFDIL